LLKGQTAAGVVPRFRRATKLQLAISRTPIPYQAECCSVPCQRPGGAHGEKREHKAEGSKRITMTDGSLLGILLRVALPITLTNLCQSSYDVVNALWLGRLGEQVIAAVEASGPLFTLLISLGSGLSTAGAVLIAQNAGARRLDALDHVAAQTLLMVAAVALAFTAVSALSAPALLRLIGVEPAVRGLAGDYLAVRYVGMGPMFGFMAMQAMLQAVGEVRFAMRVQIGSLLLNALLDPALIFDGGPLPAQGVLGAATATVVSQVLAVAIILHHGHRPLGAAPAAAPLPARPRPHRPGHAA